jgi:hypothetical protein
MDFLAGYKGKIGGIGLMLTGLGLGIKCFVENDYSQLPEALEVFALGLAAFGIRMAIGRQEPK